MVFVGVCFILLNLFCDEKEFCLNDLEAKSKTTKKPKIDFLFGVFR